MKDFWDSRYAKDEFAYGEEPNEYVKEKMAELKVGKALFPAEGEGRNAVFAAQLGWEVFAFDFSVEGKQKAEQLASSKNVKLTYEVKSFLEESYEPNTFDAICMTGVHFPPSIKNEMLKRLDSYLKVGGHIIVEVFSKEHREINKVNPEVGGPPDENMMYSLEEIHDHFENYEFIELNKLLIELKEGYAHVGESSVIRLFGKKKYAAN